MCVCVCVCARARVRALELVSARARGRVHARVALLIQHTTRIRHVVTSSVAPLAPTYLSALSHKRREFRKNVTAYKMCDLIFSATFV